MKSHTRAHTPQNPISKIQYPKTVPAWLHVLGLLLTGFGGAFAPWIWRESVALQLTAPGLAEFAKFLPEVRTVQLQIERLHFLYPLFLVILALPLLVENSQLSLPRWLRWGGRLAVFPLALAALSPVWTPAILIAPEFRNQTLIALLAMGLAVIAPLFRNLPLKVGVGLFVVGGLVALWLPWQQFGLVQTSISAVYNEPVSLGWGWWLTVAGIVLSMIGGVWVTFLSNQGSLRDNFDHE